MRLRNIPAARDAIESSIYCVNEPAATGADFHELFVKEQPLYIEIGMGKGRFIMDMARLNPGINFLGIERYSSVLYRGIQKMEADPIENARFMCEDAAKLSEVFRPGEVNRIYLNFSDPWPKDRHAKRRLTSDRFLPIYHGLLREDGLIEFKTDNRDLFDFSVDSINESPYFEITALTYDLHNDEVMNEGNVMTEYEEKFSAKGNPICKLIARRV